MSELPPPINGNERIYRELAERMEGEGRHQEAQGFRRQALHERERVEKYNRERRWGIARDNWAACCGEPNLEMARALFRAGFNNSGMTADQVRERVEERYPRDRRLETLQKWAAAIWHEAALKGGPLSAWPLRVHLQATYAEQYGPRVHISELPRAEIQRVQAWVRDTMPDTSHQEERSSE